MADTFPKMKRILYSDWLPEQTQCIGYLPVYWTNSSLLARSKQCYLYLRSCSLHHSIVPRRCLRPHRCGCVVIEHRLPLKWKMLRICVYGCITNLRSRHQEVSSIRACLSFHRLHYDWRIQYCDARDQYFFFTGRQRRFPASPVARK